MEAVMRGHRLLVFALAAAVLTGGCAGNSPTSPTAPTPTQPATPTPAPATPASSWTVTRAGDIVQAAYGSGTSYPQYVALHASGYLRLVCGPGCTWGTTVVIVPALWSGGVYYQGAPTTASWTTENGDLLISYSATIAGLAVTGQVRVSPPGVDSISATVTVNVAGSVALDARPGEAFKPLMLSSMHVSASAFDTPAAFVDSRVVPIPAAGWILQPAQTTTLWGLHGGTSSWKQNAPAVEVTMDRALPVTGWVTSSSNPNDDNVGFWNASDQVLTSYQYRLRVYKQ